MISEEQAAELIDAAVKHGVKKKADGIEAIVSASNVATSRFANNGMTQNQFPEHVSISVRVQKDGKQARLSSDRITPAGIRELVENAITSASFLEEDEEMLPLPKPEKKTQQKAVNRYDARTAAFTAEQRAKAIKTMVGIAQKQGLISAGICATGSWAEAIGNSEGLFRYHRETHAEVSVTMKHVNAEKRTESTGWAKQHSTKASDLDVSELAARAAEKAIASADAQEIEPGKYTVILEPSAVLDLLCFMDFDFTGTSFVDKLSCFLDKQRKKVLGKNIVITDDVYHPLQAGSPFDGEGLQRQMVQLVGNGKIENLVYGRRSAAKLGCTPTGHGLAEPSAEGEWPHNIVVAGGKDSVEQMVKSTKRGSTPTTKS